MNDEAYPFPLADDKGKVICQICGKSYLVISPRHLGTHNINYDEYKLRYPNALLSSKEFNKMGKIARDKNIFVQQELESIDNEEKRIKELLLSDKDNDIPENDVEPTVDEEIDFTKVYEEVPLKDRDICSISKDRILDHLRTFFTNIKKDHMISATDIQGRTIYQTISDFADPILKINIEFPNTFWHNQMSYDDPNRDLRLQEFGWKVIKIKSKGPTYKQINDAIQSL